ARGLRRRGRRRRVRLAAPPYRGARGRAGPPAPGRDGESRCLAAAVDRMGGMAVNSFMVPLGTPAPDFDLPSIDGGRVSLSDLKGAPAVLVMFLSNHCPYVRRVEQGIAAFARDYQGRVATVAICSNDVTNYPDDAAPHLAEQADRKSTRLHSSHVKISYAVS